MATGMELATAWVRIVPSVEGMQGALTKELGGADAAAATAGKKTGGKFSTGFKASMTVLSGIVVGTVVKALSSSVRSAVDLQEAGTAVQEIFGGSFSSISDWAKKANTNIGQSETEALNAAKSFGVFGTAAGLTNEENAKFSTGLAELASDFASFHNVSPQEAIEAIGSGLRGEAEPLRKFGVLMDDASLKAKAMEMGIYDGVGSLTQQEKILAANALIFDQAGAAQGDFARTSEGAANKQRILDASMANLSTTVGTALLPVLEGFLAIAQPITAWLAENPAVVKALAIGIGILTAAIVVATVAMWAMSLTPIVGWIILITVAIAAVVAAIIWMANNWDTVTAWVTKVWGGFVNWLKSIVAGVVSWWNGIWNGVKSFFINLWNSIVSAVTNAFNGYISWLRSIVAGVVSWWTGIWNGVKAGFSAIWNAIVSGARAIFNGYISFLMGLVNGFLGFWSGAWNTVGNVIRSVFGGIGSFIGGVWNSVVSKIRGAVNTIIGIVNGAIGGVNSLLGAIGKVTGIKLSIPKIPGLANGGTVTKSGYTVVGERGPELLKLPRGSQVNPNYDEVPGGGGVVFNNYAPLGQSPAQALTQFANRAKGHR